jgi:GPI-anchor transamidase subunit GAA1
MAPLVFAIAAGVPLTGFFVSPTVATKVAPPSLLLNALNLCFASAVISVTTVLNFSLAATLAVLLGLPLSLAYRPRRMETRLFKYACYVVLAVGWIVMAPGEARRAIWDWDVLRGSFAPFICIVYVPLVMQAGIVSLLP